MISSTSHSNPFFSSSRFKAHRFSYFSSPGTSSTANPNRYCNPFSPTNGSPSKSTNTSPTEGSGSRQNPIPSATGRSVHALAAFLSAPSPPPAPAFAPSRILPSTRASAVLSAELAAPQASPSFPHSTLQIGPAAAYGF